jgi:D-arabinose 1-dehydrogenase-like Zn-dependent alcohol dehydrogenase
MSDLWRSYRMPAPGQPLLEYCEPLPQPQGHEVLMRITASGVCHSDLHIWEGFFDLGGGRRMDYAPDQMPHTLGHEIAGEVVATGAEVEGLRVGERRLVYPWIGCSECANCRAGEEHTCTGRPRTLGMRRLGGFSTHVVVPHEQYLIDFAGIPETLACTYACSGLTAFSALKKVATVQGPLLIIGAGGVGLSAIRLAQGVTGAAPVVVDIDPAKRETALQAGAARAIDPADSATVKQLVDASGGFDAVVDCVGRPSTLSLSLQAVRRAGQIVVVGMFGGSLELSLPLLPFRALTLRGSLVGSLSELRELVALAQAGAVPQIPIETRPLEAAHRSLEDLRGGRIIGRVVLQP